MSVYVSPMTGAACGLRMSLDMPAIPTMSRSSEKPDPSTQFQIVETQSPPTYQDHLEQGLPLSHQPGAMSSAGSPQHPPSMGYQGSPALPAAASVGGAAKAATCVRKHKKRKEVKFRFDQNGRLIRNGALILPDAVIQALEQSYRQREASGTDTAPSSGIQYVELIEAMESNRSKTMKDQDVSTLRRLATRYRKGLYLEPKELEGKDKIKFLWSTKPADWPIHLIHVDPNNPGKDSNGKTLAKPKKEDLVPVLEYFQRCYEMKRAIYQQWYQEVKAKAGVKQEPASPAHPMAVDDGCAPAAELPSNDTDLFNMVFRQCSQQDVINTLVHVYNCIWNGPVSSNSETELADLSQRKIRNVLEQILTGSGPELAEYIETIKAILHEYEEKALQNVQCAQMVASIPTPVCDMGAGQFQTQPEYYNGNVTSVSQGGSSLSMAPSMGGSTINELELSQLGIAGGNTGILTSIPGNPVAQQMDVRASMKPLPSMQIQVHSDHDYYQKPSGIITQVAQVNKQMECQSEIDLSQWVFNEVDVNDPGLAEAANLMQLNQPQIHQMLYADFDLRSLPVPSENLPIFLLQDEEDMEE